MGGKNADGECCPSGAVGPTGMTYLFIGRASGSYRAPRGNRENVPEVTRRFPRTYWRPGTTRVDRPSGSYW